MRRCAASRGGVFALHIAAVVCAARPDHPVIGAKNFTEQVVLGELAGAGD